MLYCSPATTSLVTAAFLQLNRGGVGQQDAQRQGARLSKVERQERAWGAVGIQHALLA